MTNPRQALIQAIVDSRYDSIAYYLDDHIAHSDLTKDLFMEKLEEMMKMVSGFEDESAVITVGTDVDLGAYIKEHKYYDPVVFSIGSSCFIMDIYETHDGKFCIDVCPDGIEDGVLGIHYSLEINIDERVSFIPDEIYSNTKDAIQHIFYKEDGTFKTYFWTVDSLGDWLEDNSLLFNWICEKYSEYITLRPYGTFYKVLKAISHGYANYESLKKSIAAYKDVNYWDAEQNYHWETKHSHGLYTLKSMYFQVEEEYQGYFTMKPFFPNHYFQYKEYEQLVPFINLLRVAHCKGFEHRGKLFQESLRNSPMPPYSDDDDYNTESYTD